MYKDLLYYSVHIAVCTDLTCNLSEDNGAVKSQSVLFKRYCLMTMYNITYNANSL